MNAIIKILKWMAIICTSFFALILAIGISMGSGHKDSDSIQKQKIEEGVEVGSGSKSSLGTQKLTFGQRVEECKSNFSHLRKDPNKESPEEISCWQKVEEERSRASLGLRIKCEEEVKQVRIECSTAGSVERCMQIKMPDYGFRCSGIIAK